MTEDQEAQRLIDDVFGGTDKFAELGQRAEAATNTFLAAANAFETKDYTLAEAVLDGYLDTTATNKAQGVYDLCVTGAAQVAELIAAVGPPCGHDECGHNGTAILDVESFDDPMMKTAMHVVNTAVQGETVMLTVILRTLYESSGAAGLQALAANLVEMYAPVRDLVNGQ